MTKNCGVDVLICVAISAAELAQRTALRRRQLLVRSPRAYTSAASLAAQHGTYWTDSCPSGHPGDPRPASLRARLPCVAPALKMNGGYARSCLTVSSVTRQRFLEERCVPKNCGVDVLICVAISTAELARRVALRRR